MTPAEDFRLDGIPVFVAAPDDVAPGHCVATIVFRVGAHDELFGSAGVTVLTHNLITACLPVRMRDYVTTDSDGLFTEITVSAPDSDFGACMAAIADAIRQPDWSKLAQQQELLVAAERMELAWPEEQLLACRYGTAGAGTTVVRKFSFGRMKPSVVEAWLAERFNRNNAAIVAYGVLGTNTSLRLGDGAAFSEPINHEVPLSTPAYVEAGSEHEGMLAFQMAVPIGVRNRLALVIIAQLIERRLVTFETATREVMFSSRVVDTRTRVLTGFFTSPPHQIVDAIRAIRETLEDLSDGMAGRDMFEAQRDEVARGLLMQMASVESTVHTARVRLMPSLETLEAQIDEIATMSPDDLVAAVKVAASSLLFQGPSNARRASNVPAWKPPANPAVDGRPERLRGALRILRRRSRLVHGPEGITHLDGKHSVTVRFASCTAVMDNGLSLTLVDSSGEMFVLHPEAWEHGPEVEALVRKQVPIALFVEMDPTDDERREHETIMASVERFAPRRAIDLLTRSKHA